MGLTSGSVGIVLCKDWRMQKGRGDGIIRERKGTLTATGGVENGKRYDGERV